MQAVACNLHHKLSFVYTCRVSVYGKAIILPNQIASYMATAFEIVYFLNIYSEQWYVSTVDG